MDTTPEEKKRGYKRALERLPELEAHTKHFEQWLQSVEQWLDWVEKHIPDNVTASRKEVLEDFHFTPLGLDILERLNLDIYSAEKTKNRPEYDVKKLLRAVVALPTVVRLTGKRLERKGQNITSVFKEIIDDTLNGRMDINEISSWEPAKPADINTPAV